MIQRHLPRLRKGPQPQPSRCRRRKASHRAAASAVEFAIVANIFFIMLLACMEFARLHMVRNLSQDAAYYAARQVIVPGATADEAIAEADRIMSSLLNNGYTVQVSDLDGDSFFVKVIVSVDLTQVALFAPYFLPNSTMETAVRMRTERYDGFFEQ